MAAARAVLDVLKGQSLGDALARHADGVAVRDRALTAELAYGVCRHYFRLQAVADRLLAKPLKARDRDIAILLLVGIYQLHYTRVPPHAAISETVSASRLVGKSWASGLLNGILRRFQREGESLLAQVDGQSAARCSLPDWLLDALRQAWPADWERVAEAWLQRPPMTLRVNLGRIDRDRYVERLAEAGIGSVPVPGVPTALVLDHAMDVEQLPGFVEGLVSVQDAGAQLAAGYLDLAAGQQVLDACAAPGGKTGHILELHADCHVTALDIDEGRLLRVTDNLRRLGLAAEVVAGDAADPVGDWAGCRYDRILADVPCSATGVIRRHPDIRLLRRADDIDVLAGRQARILDRLWPLLKPGGKLLYATCSVLPRENRQQVEAFLQRQSDAELEPLSGADTGDGMCQILPGDDGMDGFFYARLRKRETP